MQKDWPFLLLLFLLVSCDFFKSTDTQTQQLVNDELLAIDWNDVDQYPLFENCDESISKEVQRVCFQETLMQYFTSAFDDLQLQVTNDINDTLRVDFLIDEHGFMTVQQVLKNAVIENEIPNFSNTVTQRLNDLTTVAPALKQGIPVSMKFRLPIVLNTTD